jgi:hypothetical protein
MSGKSIPPPPSGGSPSGVSTRNLDPMPRRGEVASIGGKRDFRAPSSHRSSPMGGSASRPRARSVGSLPSPTAGTAPTMRQSNSGAASRGRWSVVPRPQCVRKVEIRSCPKILPKGARATVLGFCIGGAVARIALRNFVRRAAPEPKFVNRGFFPSIRNWTQPSLLSILALKTQPPTLEAGAHHGSLSSGNCRRHAPHFPFFSVGRFEVYVWHSYLWV